MHYGLGYEWRPDHVWSIDSEIYYVERHNLVIFSDDVTQSADGTYSYVNFTNEARNYSYGFEAIIKREITEHLYGWLSYTYSRAREKRHADDRLGADDVRSTARVERGRELQARRRLRARCAVPARERPARHAGDRRDLRRGHRWLRARCAALRARFATRTSISSMRASSATGCSSAGRFGLYIDVINVLNTTNVEAYQYDYRYRQRSPITSFPILPTLGVKGTW